MTEKNIVDIYDRTHNLSSPEHAAAFAARIHQSEDVKIKISGTRVQIVTSIREGESYSREMADKDLETLARDMTPQTNQ